MLVVTRADAQTSARGPVVEAAVAIGLEQTQRRTFRHVTVRRVDNFGPRPERFLMKRSMLDTRSAEVRGAGADIR